MGAERAGERGDARDRHGGTGEEDQRQRRGVDCGGRSPAPGADDAARGSWRVPKTSARERGIMSRLKERIAVVSGAAAGIGRAAAVRLAAEGAKIEILDVKNASEVCEEIRASGGVAYSSICDVTNEEQIAEAVGGVERRHGR